MRHHDMQRGGKPAEAALGKGIVQLGACSTRRGRLHALRPSVPAREHPRERKENEVRFHLRILLARRAKRSRKGLTNEPFVTISTESSPSLLKLARRDSPSLPIAAAYPARTRAPPVPPPPVSPLSRPSN